jgi:hypothetical protein
MSHCGRAGSHDDHIDAGKAPFHVPIVRSQQDQKRPIILHQHDSSTAWDNKPHPMAPAAPTAPTVSTPPAYPCSPSPTHLALRVRLVAADPPPDGLDSRPTGPSRRAIGGQTARPASRECGYAARAAYLRRGRLGAGQLASQQREKARWWVTPKFAISLWEGSTYELRPCDRTPSCCSGKARSPRTCSHSGARQNARAGPGWTRGVRLEGGQECDCSTASRCRATGQSWLRPDWVGVSGGGWCGLSAMSRGWPESDYRDDGTRLG